MDPAELSIRCGILIMTFTRNRSDVNKVTFAEYGYVFGCFILSSDLLIRLCKLEGGLTLEGEGV